MAEIFYLGVKEWDLELKVVYTDKGEKFLGAPVKPFSELAATDVDALIICTYDEHNPMLKFELPEGIKRTNKMYWLFDEEFYDNPKEENDQTG